MNFFFKHSTILQWQVSFHYHLKIEYLRNIVLDLHMDLYVRSLSRFIITIDTFVRPITRVLANMFFYVTLVTRMIRTNKTAKHNLIMYAVADS